MLLSGASSRSMITGVWSLGQPVCGGAASAAACRCVTFEVVSVRAGGFRGGSVSTIVMTGGTSGFGAIAAERMMLSGNARLILVRDNQVLSASRSRST